MNDTILKLNNLEAGYVIKQENIKAVDGVSLELKQGEFLGIAGESGCGKSTLAYTIMGLLEDNGKVFNGDIIYNDRNITNLADDELKKIRWVNISMVFQSAMNSLNPVLRIKEQLIDALLAHKEKISLKAAAEKAKEMLKLVDIPEDRMNAYPHQLSGGMKQRVMIAMAMILEPDIIIMDEPTTALDVVVQRTIIDKITDLQKQFNFSVIFITHDLSLLIEISDNLIIMYSGQIVETGPAATVYNNPEHPYTKGLMQSFPSLTGEKIEFGGIPGKPPDFLKLPDGCRYHPRCPIKKDICMTEDPGLLSIGEKHKVRCHIIKGEEKG